MYLKLNDKYSTLVCECHYELVKDQKWSMTGNGYAYRMTTKNYKQTIHYLHRVITGAPKGFDVDHVNRDKLDNRCSNLRVCSRGQNEANVSLRKNNTSGYRGVSWSKKDRRWHSRIQNGESYRSLGAYKDKMDAVRAYEKAAKEKYGDFYVGAI